MEIRVLVAAGVLAVWGADVAAARVPPNPPPSGIVIHLFGPDSVMQSVAPALAEAPGAGPQPVGAPGPGAAAGGAAAGGAAAPGAAEPSWGNVLHQMFVTGDPEQPNQPARGKMGHQLED